AGTRKERISSGGVKLPGSTAKGWQGSRSPCQPTLASGRVYPTSRPDAPGPPPMWRSRNLLQARPGDVRVGRRALLLPPGRLHREQLDPVQRVEPASGQQIQYVPLWRAIAASDPLVHLRTPGARMSALSQGVPGGDARSGPPATPSQNPRQGLSNTL